jgi:uncharacterized protein (TIGR00266 family)
VSEGAKFCSGCGQPVSGTPAVFDPGPLAAPAPLEFEIHGDNLQIVRIKMKPGDEVYAEAGKMVYKTPSVSWETKMSGNSIGEKLWGALKRTAMGESLFLTYFRSNGGGELGLAGDYPGRIQAFHLEAGKSFLVQRDGFICAQSTVRMNIAFQKRLGAGLFGGEGFILQKLTGPGTAFIHAGGDHVEFQLGPGEILQVDTGCVVAFEETVHYDIQLAGGIKTALFGGEGLFLATLQGPGRVIIQSLTLEKLRRQLSGTRTGGDERSGIGAITNIFGSED